MEVQDVTGLLRCLLERPPPQESRVEEAEGLLSLRYVWELKLRLHSVEQLISKPVTHLRKCLIANQACSTALYGLKP